LKGGVEVEAKTMSMKNEIMLIEWGGKKGAPFLPVISY